MCYFIGVCKNFVGHVYEAIKLGGGRVSLVLKIFLFIFLGVFVIKLLVF